MRQLVASAAMTWFLSGVAGCSSPAASPADQATPGAKRQASAAAATAPSAAATATVAAATPPLPTAAGSAARLPVGPSPFHVAALVPADDDARFLPTGGVTFVVARRTIFEIEGAEVRFDPRKLAGFERTFTGVTTGVAQLAAIVGRGPVDMRLFVNQYLQIGAHADEYRWNGTRWAFVEQHGTVLEDVAPWTDGSFLLLWQGGAAARLTQVGASRGATVPQLTGPYGQCAKLAAERVLGFPNGDVLALGHLCIGSTLPGHQLGIRRWTAKTRTDTVVELPLGQGKRTGAEALGALDSTAGFVAGWSGDDYFAASAPYLARFDEKSARVVATPIQGPISDMAVQSDGVLWVIERQRAGTGGSLWRRGTTGAWAPVALPQHDGLPVTPLRIWPRAVGDVWLVGTTRQTGVLLHTQRSATVAQIPQILHSELTRMRPARPDCGPYLVVLHSPRQSAPRDFDYPATRQALKGNLRYHDGPFLEFSRIGQRFLAYPTEDLSAARALAAIMRRKVKGVSPQVVCHTPQNVLRHLQLDARTGTWTIHEAP